MFPRWRIEEPARAYFEERRAPVRPGELDIVRPSAAEEQLGLRWYSVQQDTGIQEAEGE